MNQKELQQTFDGLFQYIDERYSDVIYNGCFNEYEDPMDYIKKGSILNGA